MTKEIVILGGNFAGLAAAKVVLDKINPKAGKDAFHVTLISSSTHVYFNLGAPRVLVEPERLKDVFFPIDKVFAKYPKSQFTFVQGTVTGVDSQSKSVTYSQADDSISTASYETLIIATGARTDDISYKLVGSHEESVTAVKNHIDSFSAAKTIAIAGGGPTGVETAGELAAAYKNKDVILYTGASRPLEALANLGFSAEKKLHALGVKVVNGIKVESTSVKDGKTVLNLSNGTQTTVDVYIPVVGVHANTQFLDSSLLDKRGFVVTDDYLRVKGVESIYAIGDVVSALPKTVIDLDRIQKGVLEATLLHDLVSSSNKLVAHGRATDITIAVPISKDGGVGAFKGWTFPNFVVRMAKSKDFMIPKAAGLFGIA